MSAAAQHKIKGFGKRSHYTNLEHFRTRRLFQIWWDEQQAQQPNWRLNTRFESVNGLTEYWHCAFKQERIYTCPARLRIIFHPERGIFVFESKNRQHDHSELPPPNKNDIKQVKILKPFELHKAQIVDLIPRIVISSNSISSTSTAVQQQQ